MIKKAFKDLWADITSPDTAGLELFPSDATTAEKIGLSVKGIGMLALAATIGFKVISDNFDLSPIFEKIVSVETVQKEAISPPEQHFFYPAPKPRN